MAESLYEQCSRVIRDDYAKRATSFTEIDVVNAIKSPSWGEREFKKALSEAQQVCAAMFRKSRLVRFGPVKPPGQSAPDFLRKGKGGKMVYAGFDKLRMIDTKINGTFSAVTYADATRLGMVKPGRSAGIDRDDFKDWTDQLFPPSRDVEILEPVGGHSNNGAGADERLANAQARVAELEREVETLRSARIASPTMLVEIPLDSDLIEQLVEALLPQLREALNSA